LIPQLGFKKYKIMYRPDKRYSGGTKYNVKKMFQAFPESMAK